MNSLGSDSNDKKKDKENHHDELGDDDADKMNEPKINSNYDAHVKDKKSDVVPPDRPVDPRFKRLVWYLIASTRGGVNRARIIDFLKDNPSNANQLSSQLKLDYKTIIHHLKVLKENSLVVTENEESYGATYFISPLIEKNYSAFREIVVKIGKK